MVIKISMLQKQTIISVTYKNLFDFCFNIIFSLKEKCKKLINKIRDLIKKSDWVYFLIF